MTSDGHQNSTARKPALDAREKRSRKGTSVKRIERFAENRTDPDSMAVSVPSNSVDDIDKRTIVGEPPEILRHKHREELATRLSPASHVRRHYRI